MIVVDVGGVEVVATVEVAVPSGGHLGEPSQATRYAMAFVVALHSGRKLKRCLVDYISIRTEVSKVSTQCRRLAY